MRLSQPILYSLFLVTACGLPEAVSQQETPTTSLEPTGGLIEDEVVPDAVLSIETTYPYGGGVSGPYRCDDGADGYGGLSNLLSNDGNNYSWQGAWRRGTFEGDPNSGMRCSTSLERVRPVDTATWPAMKKEILTLKLQMLAGSYRCNNTTIPCPSDFSILTHDITIDGQAFKISWMTGISDYLPPKLQRLNEILQTMDPPWNY